jgi:hypothetical protein
MSTMAWLRVRFFLSPKINGKQQKINRPNKNSTIGGFALMKKREA